MNRHAGSARPILSESTEASQELIRRAQGGDGEALNRLCSRYIPLLRRFASGRLPAHARALLDTDDLVQETVVKTIDRLPDFEYRREGALLAYLRMILVNRIRREARNRKRRAEVMETLDKEEQESSRSPLEDLLGRERVERLDQALAELRDIDREAVIARVEMGLSYEELAAVLDKPSADAARMTVTRALVRLAEKMTEIP